MEDLLNPAADPPRPPLAPRRAPEEGIHVEVPPPSAEEIRAQRGKVQVDVAGVRVVGGLAPEIVSRLLRQRLGQLRRCYVDGLLRAPRLRGMVVVTLAIDLRGDASSVRATPGDARLVDVAACMARQLEGVTFPKPEGSVVDVSWPLVLVPK
jgi:hypothetical protein